MCIKTSIFQIKDKYFTNDYIRDAAIFVVLTMALLNLFMLFTHKYYPLSMYVLLLEISRISLGASVLWLCISIGEFIYYLEKSKDKAYLEYLVATNFIQDTFTKFMVFKADVYRLSTLEKCMLVSKLFASKCMPAILLCITSTLVYHAYKEMPYIQYIILQESLTTNTNYFLKF